MLRLNNSSNVNFGVKVHKLRKGAISLATTAMMLLSLNAIANDNGNDSF